jgi:SSS family solute:Na+ symporter
LDDGGSLLKMLDVLGWADFAILAGAIALLFVIAYITGRKASNTRDFFLGNRSIPWLVVCMSFVATEISAMTIVAAPSRGYAENWFYLQMFIGSALARVFVAYFFIPAYYKHDCTTIYQYLRARFGPGTQYAGSVFFFITRLLASGVRLYAACLGIHVILGCALWQALLLFTLASVIFIAFGGVKAVVWNGAYQTVFFYAAGIAVIVYLAFHIHGGAGEAWETASKAGRLELFNFKWDLEDPKTLWAAALNAFVIGLVVFGTDQELVQRLLTVETRRASQRALVGTIAAGLPITCMYMAIGTLLFVFYQQNPGLPLPDKADKILSHFTREVLPFGLKGVVLAAIILASIDSPLSSLASSFVTDIYRPLIRPNATEKHLLRLSRLGIVYFGVVLALLAFDIEALGLDGILWVGFEIFSLTGGSLLGVFLLGVLTKRKGNLANVLAMITSAVWMASLMFMIKYQGLQLGWSWLIVLGTVSTFVLGYLFSLLEEKGREQKSKLAGAAGGRPPATP